MAYVVSHADDHITIVLAGEADVRARDELREVLFDALAARPTHLTVDVRGVVFIDSTSIGTLLAVRRAARQRGCAFVVTNARGQVRRVLNVAGVLAALTRTGPVGEAANVAS
nr:STAS domain-containing protein [Planosporangium mesophilum]